MREAGQIEIMALPRFELTRVSPDGLRSRAVAHIESAYRPL